MNIKKVLKTIILIVIVLASCVLGLIFWVSDSGSVRGKDMQNINYGEYIKYVDIFDVVKEAFVTDNGYTNELSKYMTEDVFKHTNYKSYNVNNPKYTKPFKVDFSLKEVYQTKDNANDLVYVDMIHSIEIKDANDNMIGGSHDAGITFTVKITENGWYIIDDRQYSDGRLR